MAAGSNKLLIKFFVQSNPTAFLSLIEPPGYTSVVIIKNNNETISVIRTENFLLIFFAMAAKVL